MAAEESPTMPQMGGLEQDHSSALTPVHKRDINPNVTLESCSLSESTLFGKRMIWSYNVRAQGYIAKLKLNMEKPDKVYLVFGRPAVEPDIDQLIRAKRTSMTLRKEFWSISILFFQFVK